jgi:hypothetical protein
MDGPYWDTPPLRRNNTLYDLQPSFVPPPPQQSVWVPDQVWDMPHQQRNNVLYDLQPPSVPSPPPAVTNALLSGASIGMVTIKAEFTLTGAPGVNEDIEAHFQEALRRAANLTSCIDQLRKASRTREIGPGHNQGPSLEDLDDVEDLIALLKDQGPRVKTAIDAKALIEQTEKVKWLPERIWSLLKAAGLFVLGVGAHEVTKDLTAPLWDDVAHRIVDLCRAIEVWASLLPPM